MQYKSRAIEDYIKKTEKGFKALLLTGPRQVGKSTILQQLYLKHDYLTFDDPILVNEAKSEPGLFFRNHRPPMVLDEVQYISELFPYIKMECDKSDEKGAFLLTGSQQYHLMRNVSESLAGRVAILELSGLSLREHTDCTFNEPFVPSEDYIQRRGKDVHTVSDIWRIIHRGGYPALLDENVDWGTFYASYVQTYIERDVNALENIKDKLKFTRFLTAAAARTGQMLNYSTIAEQVDVTVATVKAWISILETSGIVYLLQPYSNSALNRAIKTPKLYFRDTGLVCYLTKYLTPETAMNGALAGSLFETFVVSEILKSFSNVGVNYQGCISYYRGKDKNRRKENGEEVQRESEIDILIERDGVIYPVEIKMSANPKLDMTNAFDILDRIPDKKRGLGVVLCMYTAPLWLSERVVALPIEYI